MKWHVLPAVGLAVLTNQAFASEIESTYDTRSYVDIMATLQKMDDARNIDTSGFGGSVTWGIPLSERWSWENQIGMYGLDTGTRNSTDYYQISLKTNARYNFGDHEGFDPFLLAGIGITRNDVVPNSDDSINPMFNVGIGLISPELFSSELRLRMEVRYIYDDFDGAGGDIDIPSSKGNGPFNDWHFSVGLSIPLGSTKPIYTETIVERHIVDSDGDSIDDSMDMCPNTLSGADVDARGCLLKNQVIVLRNITFELGSATIEASSNSVLDQLVATLKSQQDFNLEVVGHSDNVGAADFNQTLSEQRAQSIATYLTEQGINPDRIKSKGMGESQPIASNVSVSGRAMNRRVEFYITER